MKVWYWPGAPDGETVPDFPPIDMSVLAFDDGRFTAPESGFYSFHAGDEDDGIVCWMREGVTTRTEYA